MQRKLGNHLPIKADLPPRIGRNPRLERLERLDALFDWARLGAVVQDIYAAPTGRPSYPPLMMVKVLLLQQWYATSDPEMAAALCDRLSFRRFAGLGLADESPHYATISRFRQQLTNRGLAAAKIAESTVAEALIMGDEVAVYADRAYESKQRRARLKTRGIKDRIMHRAHQYQARLPYWQRQRNRLIARVRAPVEQVFGTLKRLYHYRRGRYLGLARNTTELWCKGIADNLRRAEGRGQHQEPSLCKGLTWWRGAQGVRYGSEVCAG